MTDKKYTLFTGFGGVALADILANSVAMMIILIVITLLVKQEQEEQRLEKIDEVGVLLSRELASSVVMNKLPTSAPARLHDYHSSPMDRNPQFHLMPIIELHANHIRDYYHNTKISFAELLLPNNAFDKYLSRLSPLQLQRIRIDIYEVRLFYIVMSILKAKGVLPKHWHFLQYAEGQENGEYINNKEQEESPQSEEPQAEQQQAQGENFGTGQQGIDPESHTGEADVEVGIPTDAELLMSTPGAQQAYPYDDLAYAQSGQAEEARDQEMPDVPGELSHQTEKQKLSDQVFAGLSDLFNRAAGQNRQQQTGPRQTRFRNATPQQENQQAQQPGSGNQNAEVQAVPLHSIIAALFAFMKEAQQAADQGQYDVLEHYNFYQDVAPYIGAAIEPALWVTIQQLTQGQAAADENKNKPIFVTAKKMPAAALSAKEENALLVPVNTRLQSLQLQQTELQQPPTDIPGKVSVTTRLSLFPEIYTGVQVNLSQNSFVLMHPEQRQPHEYRWRMISYVEADLSNVITAFVYAAVKNGQLILNNEENNIKINHIVLSTTYPVLPARDERWLLLLYGLTALLIVFSLLSRLRV